MRLARHASEAVDSLAAYSFHGETDSSDMALINKEAINGRFGE